MRGSCSHEVRQVHDSDDDAIGTKVRKCEGLLMRGFPLVVLLIAVAAVMGLTFGTWRSDPHVAPPSAAALEAGLLAPCCFGGTLATHESEIARELRAEIERRVANGESTAAIEADMIERYGSQVEAMPNQGAFANSTVIAVDMMIIAAAALAITVWRWRKANEVADSARTSAQVANGPESRDYYDERLDSELQDID